MQVTFEMSEHNVRRLKTILQQEVESTQHRANMLHTTKAEQDVYAFEIAILEGVILSINHALASESLSH